MNQPDQAILGKIILLQSTLHAMNEDVAMARFVCRGLSVIPGIDSLSMFIRGKFVSLNDRNFELAEKKKRYFDLLSENKEAELSLLKKNEKLEFLKLETIFDLYGFLIIKLKDKKQFELYKSYIENTLNLVALVVENNTQKQELLNNKNLLEKTVAQRTKELAQTNRALQKEIVERKAAEETVIAALKEKEILLRELYHRTKNNMQVIRAMLSIQSNATSNTEVKRTFMETENRIAAMALVHQKLYQSSDLSRINLNSYICDLVNMIMQSYGITQEKIALNLDLSDVHVLIDMAIPCGLLLNELLSNSVKHAFPGDHRGEINIRLHLENEKTIALTFADNGVGVPLDFEFRKQETLGLQTIIALCEHQLQGEIRFESVRGVTCFIRLNNELFADRL